MLTPRISAILVLSAIVAGVGALSLLPPDRLEEMPPLCLWTLLSGRICLGCGTTRALSSILRGDLALALSYNRNVLVTAPLIVILAAGSIRTLWRTRFKAVANAS